MKTQEIKLLAPGHTANKTPVASDSLEQNPGVTHVLIAKSLNILRSLFSYLLNGYNNKP